MFHSRRPLRRRAHPRRRAGSRKDAEL